MTVIAVGVGCILYQYCVKPEMQFTTQSYLVGYGLILPFWLVFPSVTSHYFGVYNKIARFTLTTVVTCICSFRTIAAIHGFSPRHTTTTMKRFVMYYSTPILGKYNATKQKFVRAKPHVIANRAVARASPIAT